MTTKTEFEAATGVLWPEEGTPLRQYLYFHSVFGYPMDGVPAYKDNLDVTMTQIVDSWTDATWIDADTVSIITAWLNSGIATNSAGSIVFESVGVCFDRKELTDECNDYADYERILRIYEKPKAGTIMTGLALSCFNAVNAVRVSNGLSALEASSALTEAAERHAEDLTTNFEYAAYSHTGSDATSPYDRINDTEYFMYWYGQSYSVGENIGWNGDADPVAKALENWEASEEGHWEMILNEDMVETGIATITKEDGVTTFVQVFGYRQYIWPGFTPIDTTDILEYIDNNFTFENEADVSRVFKCHIA